jgi:hypothetical protein
VSERTTEIELIGQSQLSEQACRDYLATKTVRDHIRAYGKTAGPFKSVSYRIVDIPLDGSPVTMFFEQQTLC